MSKTAIETRALSKQYLLHSGEIYSTLRDRLARVPRAAAGAARRVLTGCGPAERPAFWALRDIDLAIAEGEVVGIIGRNGAGKSTLLKVLARITRPTTGGAIIRGRVGSLLEVGTGFHLELTGRENVMVNGAILGMRRADILRKFDEIVDFAGVEQFIDTPVKHYSSGMRLRLAFAVAAHLDADILIIDEVLAVGDAAFQRKCFERMNDVANRGRTVIVVSHQMEAIETLCPRAVWLDGGHIVADGKSSDIVRTYLSKVLESAVGTDLALRTDRRGDGTLRFTSVTVVDSRGNPAPCILSGEAVTLRLDYVAERELDDVEAAIWFKDGLGRRLMCAYTRMTASTFATLPPRGSINCTIERFPLAPATYVIDINSTVRNVLADKLEPALQVDVVGADFYGTGHKTTGYGDVLCTHRWSVSNLEVARL
jgi:lipopolysaccharide transport system ATP-binding protein